MSDAIGATNAVGGMGSTGTTRSDLPLEEEKKKPQDMSASIHSMATNMNFVNNWNNTIWGASSTTASTI